MFPSPESAVLPDGASGAWGAGRWAGGGNPSVGTGERPGTVPTPLFSTSDTVGSDQSVLVTTTSGAAQARETTHSSSAAENPAVQKD